MSKSSVVDAIDMFGAALVVVVVGSVVVVVCLNLYVGENETSMTAVFVGGGAVISNSFVASVLVVVSSKLSNCKDSTRLLQLSLPQRHTVQFTPLLQENDSTSPFIPQPRA